MKAKVFGITVLICLNLAGLILNLTSSETASMIIMAVLAVDIFVAVIFLLKLK